MTEGLPERKTHALVDGDDRLISDLLCIKCGWNLRTYLVSDRCPHCMHGVSDSVYGDYLIHSDPVAVRRLADAAKLVQFGAILLAALVGVALFTTVVGTGDLTGTIDSLFRIVIAGAVIAPVPAAVGLVVLTPHRTLAFYKAHYKRRYSSLRARLELAMLVVLLAASVFTLSYYYLWFASQLGMVLWFAIPLGAFFRGISKLMKRLPNLQVARSANTIMIATIVFAVFVLSVLTVQRFVANDPGVEELLLVLSGISVLAGLGIGIGAIRLIMMVHRVLRRAAP